MMTVCEEGVADWEASERAWIARFRADGAALLNATDGGAGSPGWVPDDAFRAASAARSRARKGEKRSEESKQRMSEAQLRNEAAINAFRKRSQRPKSEETRRRLSLAQRGKKHSEESKKKMSESRQDVSEETRAKLREAVMKRPEEQRQAFAKCQVGKTKSEETKMKMSEARRAYWAQKKGGCANSQG